jgi:hypothetical protein
MGNLNDRIVKLAMVIRQAENIKLAQTNTGMGDYVQGLGQNPGDAYRMWNPGDAGGQPTNPSMPNPISRDERNKDERLQYHKFNVSMSIIDRGGAMPVDSGGIHFGDIVDIAPAGNGVVTLF